MKEIVVNLTIIEHDEFVALVLAASLIPDKSWDSSVRLLKYVISKIMMEHNCTQEEAIEYIKENPCYFKSRLQNFCI